MESGVIGLNYWYQSEGECTTVIDLRTKRYLTVPGADPSRGVSALRGLPPEEESGRRGRLEGTISRVKLSSSGACGRDCTYCFKGDRRSEPVPLRVGQHALEHLFRSLGAEAHEYDVYYDAGSQPLGDDTTLAQLLEHGAALTRRTGKPINWRVASDGVRGPGSDRLLRKLADAGARLVVRIDGPQPIHNRARVLRNGHCSHEEALRLLDCADACSLPIDGEAVITGDYPFPERVIHYLRGLGCDRVATRPVRSNRAFDLQVDRFRTGYEQLFAMLRHEVRAGDFRLLPKITDDQSLAPLWRLLPETPVPPLTRRELVVDARGFYHVCDRLVGSESRVVGSVEDGIDWMAVARDPSVVPRSPCSHCWARFACGGACRLTGIHQNYSPESLDRAPCSFNEFLVEKNLELLATAIAPTDRTAGLRDILQASRNSHGSSHQSNAPDAAGHARAG